MNTFQNFKNTFALSLLFTATALTAQNEIQSTATDFKYGNTTVVYAKDSNYNDQAILSQLDNSYGIGDVVRITVATPENQAASEMLASEDPAVMFAIPQAKKAETPKVVMMAPPKKAETVVVTSTTVAPIVKPKTVEAPVASIGGKTVKKGSIFRLEKLYFDVDKYELKDESEAELNRLYEFLNTYPDVTIELRGHTNNQMWPNVDFAKELSTNRAQAVADWLIAKGIDSSRIKSKGFGWTMPVEPNITAEGRKKNQRVEVKILSM